MASKKNFRTARSVSPEKNCFRRSPRFASAPSRLEGSSGTPTMRSMPSELDASALTLVVVGGVNIDEPVPLKIYDPNSAAAAAAAEDKCFLLRSPSYTTDKYSHVDKKNAVAKIVKVLQRNFVRRSPRLSLASPAAEIDGRKMKLRKSETAVGCRLIEWSDSIQVRGRSVERKKDKSLRLVGEKCPRSRTAPERASGAALSDSMDETARKKGRACLGNSNSKVVDYDILRRSPRLASCSSMTENGNLRRESLFSTEPLSSARNSANAVEKSLRRSPRLSLTPVEDVKGNEIVNLNCKLMAFPDILSLENQQPKKKESTSGKSNLRIVEKRIRSQENVKATLTESAEVSIEEKTTVGNGTVLGNASGEKCLRSRKISFCSVGGGNVKTRTSVSWDKQPTKETSSEKKQKNQKIASFFIGEPVLDEEARERWQWRYELKSQRSKGQSWVLNADEEDEIILNVECHYTRAKVNNRIFNLGDCAYIKGEGKEKYIGKILEFFKTTDGEDYFRVQWFFRAEDTVMKGAADFHDKKRVFLSSLTNDNLLDCIISKLNIVESPAMINLKSCSIPPSDFYYDMEYCLEYSTFRNLLTATTTSENSSSCQSYKAELALLDLYAGCGGMSTGLCLGAKLSGVNLVTRWAVDFDSSACDSLKLNHPETQVRNEAAEDFLELLRRWEQLCKEYSFNDSEEAQHLTPEDAEGIDQDAMSPENKTTTGEYEVLCLVDICYGDPNDSGKRGLNFKVRWKGYGPDEDTWEPIEGLSNCQQRIRDFIKSGSSAKILPLPGGVDVICGGPPCQGISGYNRFRNVDAPLTDERNRQIVIFMDIVHFLKPKFVLMENVSDILRFDEGSLGRYALSRLVHMRYQARLGIMAAGCYGLPQFRLRVFLYGALPSEKLPQFPLPTHDVVVKHWPAAEFERNTVAYDEGQPRELEEPVILRDAISDLPAVTNYETREEMTYEMPPETEFQRYIRSTKYEMMGFASNGITETKNVVLYDHRPYQLHEDNFIRVCQIPHKKGANFRDLPGVVVGDDNVVHRDATKEPMMLPSGKPMVPDCVFTFEQGKSKRPYARVWWDETVATVVTFPNIRSQPVLHPEQDRVLTIREYARLQGFPDFYRFCGTSKERYCQVGNAVSVPVARALGYALGIAYQKLSKDEPLIMLPPKFTFQLPSRD